MIDFTKQLNNQEIIVEIDPVEIYNKLDRLGSAGPLRDAQKQVLTEWFNERKESKDIILKMHTGEGKTLVGLLMLQSRLNEFKTPCIYVAPNIQLADQTVKNAIKFGVPYVYYDKDTSDIPLDFLDSNKIMITYVQKVFNGKTKFHLDNDGVEIGSFVVDDPHACIDSIRSSCTIKISRTSPAYKELLCLFELEIKSQGEGSYNRLASNNNKNHTLIQIPYWGWIDKKEEVTRVLAKHEGDDSGILFAYPLLMNDLDKCSAFITCNGIEITPDFSVIGRFTSFCKAQQRIMMSATTQDDSAFIKDLGISAEAVEKPLINETDKWSGEKMIIFPSMIHKELKADKIRQMASNWIKLYNIVALIPGGIYYDLNYKGTAFVKVTNSNMKETIRNLNTLNKGNSYVFINRYDGIDLSDEMCRILIIDNMPIFENLSDRYEVSCREDSDLINIKKAQKIEQGMGRSVRSLKDYSVILVIGPDITGFMNNTKTQKFFSLQTRSQIKIAKDVNNLAKKEVKLEEKADSTLQDLIFQCLNRDQGWKNYYETEMNKMNKTSQEHKYIEFYKKEYDASVRLTCGDISEACKIYRVLSEMSSTDSEKGWYLQKVAKYTYLTNKVNSKKIQEKAFKCNNYLLKTDLLGYKKIRILDDNRLDNIAKYLSTFKIYSELDLQVSKIIGDLSFGISSNKFEAAVCEIGMLLGFESQRPDLVYKTGPDNLWAVGKNKYFAFECKNEVLDTRNEISKSEIDQIHDHKAWFENHYNNSDCDYFFIHQTNKRADNANINFSAKVILPLALQDLKNHILSFIKAFQFSDIHNLSKDTIKDQLIANKLLPLDIISLGSSIK